jgi:hypothetical protein
MGLGRRIWILWRLRPYTLGCALLALLVAVWSVEKISFLPPKLSARSLEMATATTHVVVDTPTSTVLDLRQNTYDLEALTQRAILVGNVIANGPVRASIARQAGVPVAAVQITPPLTRQVPSAVVGSGPSKRATDLFKSTNQYRISIQANPTVPLLDIYAQAPSAGSAQKLANAAVDGLRAYLKQLAAAQQIPPKDQIRVLQLGRARGTTINASIDWQTAIVAFLLTFALAAATLILVSRVVRGFQGAALADPRARA